MVGLAETARRWDRGGDLRLPAGWGGVWSSAVVNQGGVVRYLDGQSGQVASFAGYTRVQLLRTN